MIKIYTFACLIFILGTPCEAYVGPGMGGGLIAAIVGIIFAIFAAIIGLLWFPIKRFFKKKKEKNKKN